MMPAQRMSISAESLERLYNQYNRRELVSPDPLELVLRYDSTEDREIAALVASSLAYGRVVQITGSVSAILDAIGSPSRFLRRSSESSLQGRFGGFKHRFTTGDDIVSLFLGMKCAIADYGSLRACFEAGMKADDPDIFGPLCRFVRRLRECCDGSCASLLPCPENGSACKRLNLFLKWMVRRDEIDPGGWDGIDRALLIVPLDTHMHRIGLLLGMTRRKQADLKTAREITAWFRKIAPEDPTKYDFASTRLGMRHGARIGDRLAEELQIERLQHA